MRDFISWKTEICVGSDMAHFRSAGHFGQAHRPAEFTALLKAVLKAATRR
jgi:hypothetical protein